MESAERANQGKKPPMSPTSSDAMFAEQKAKRKREEEMYKIIKNRKTVKEQNEQKSTAKVNDIFAEKTTQHANEALNCTGDENRTMANGEAPAAPSQKEEAA